MEHILQAVEKIMPEIIEIRREIHRHPEIGRKEVRTTALIKEKLMEYGVDEIQSPMPTGAVALIHARQSEPISMLFLYRRKQDFRSAARCLG